ARDKATGRENKVSIQNSGGLSKEEIERMKRDAEAHEAEDRKRREAIDAKNQAEHLIYTTEKALREHGDKVAADVRANIESAINNLKDAIKSEDTERIRRSMDNLHQASMKLGEAMYAQQKGAGGASGAAPEAQSDRATASGKKKDEDVIDAEYEVKE
ncbi:MAG: Hsp70 family protein, partial [Phycisphaerae bacterium]|nr:Hsp70 family protein [Phycisphaerae bacterium]